MELIIILLAVISVALVAWGLTIILQNWLEDYEKKYVSEHSRMMEQLFIFENPRKLFLINLTITILFAFSGYILMESLFYAILFGVAGFFFPKLFLRWKKKKREKNFDDQFVDALSILSSSLRSGMSLIQAVQEVVTNMTPPISQEFALILREYRMGATVEEALINLSDRMPSEDLKLMVSSTNIVHSRGGNLTEIIDTLTFVIRERSKIEKKTKALTSQGKLQGIIVGLLPTFLGGMFFILDPNSMKIMFSTQIGNAAIAIMITLQIIGFLLMRKITSIVV